MEPGRAASYIPAMSYLLAILAPPVSLALNGRPFQALLNAVLWFGSLMFILLPFVAGQLGWAIAVVWALIVVHGRRSEARDRRLVEEALRRRG